ncbi:MAG: hypothetical protein PWP50_744 [Synergistaceae bacterium]|nr:hypothetical protein [Synergistaceae bacterium]
MRRGDFSILPPWGIIDSSEQMGGDIVADLRLEITEEAKGKLRRMGTSEVTVALGKVGFG